MDYPTPTVTRVKDQNRQGNGPKGVPVPENFSDKLADVFQKYGKPDARAQAQDAMKAARVAMGVK